MADFHIWEGVYPHMDQAPECGSGFAGPLWMERTRAKVGEELRLFRENGEIPDSAKYRQYVLPVVAALVGHGRDRLSILDFGGGMGTGYLALMADMAEVNKVDFHVVEMASVCQAGRELFAGGPAPHFHETLPEQPATMDIVHCGSVLQYINDWRGLLSRLAQFRPSHMVLSDLMAGDIDTFATVQNYYGDTIPHWFWNVNDVIDTVHALGYRLLFKAPYVGVFLGEQGPLPMDNFPPERRLRHACHLVFAQA